MNIHCNLKKYRENKGLSQNEIAEKLSVTRQTISKWENGKSCPDLDSLINLSNIYEVSIDELLKNEKNMHREFPEYEINDKSQMYFILSVISLLMPLGIFVAIVILFCNFKYTRKYKKVVAICVISIVFNLIKIMVNGYMILFR